MKTFTFRLDQALRWRVTALEKEEASLERTRVSLELARGEKVKLLQALSRADSSPGKHAFLRGADLHALGSYTARLNKEITRADREVSVLSESITRQLDSVCDCDRNVRLLERLRGRRMVEWQAEMSRESDGFSSDFSASQWLRSRQDSRARPKPD